MSGCVVMLDHLHLNFQLPWHVEEIMCGKAVLLVRREMAIFWRTTVLLECTRVSPNLKRNIFVFPSILTALPVFVLSIDV